MVGGNRLGTMSGLLEVLEEVVVVVFAVMKVGIDVLEDWSLTKKTRQMELVTRHDEESPRDGPTNQEMSQDWVNGLSTVSPAVDHGQTQSCQHFRLHLVLDMGRQLHPVHSVS